MVKYVQASLYLCVFMFLVFSCGTAKRGENATNTKMVVETASFLDPLLPPSSNFNLKNWSLSIPVDRDHNGKPDKIYETALNKGFESSNYFYTADDGGMVFRCPVGGLTTTRNSKYQRVELREMLRGADTLLKNKGVTKNNWVFGSAPKKDLQAAGAIDGEMTATLAVNKVTTTGKKNHVGRLVIGQIHANTDEPIKIFYRKLPNNELGSVYFSHEINHGKDVYFEMVGSKKSDIANPKDGIALNEKFSYKIKVIKNDMWVTLSREDKPDILKHVDMRKSGFDEGGQYQYFKAGLYHLNNTGEPDDYAQVTFYKLDVVH